jgi:DNA-binding XRE family transcriptional regulator
MPFLYVAAFSSDHIKVGCSNDDAEKRIAQHAERVACMGVRLIEKFVVECPWPVGEREGALIEKCADAAEQRFQREWFTGLSFSVVCGWAQEAAAMAVDRAETFGDRLRSIRRDVGMTQSELGKGLGLAGDDAGKATVSHWETNRHAPNLDQLVMICRRLDVSADRLLGLEGA